MDLPTVRYPRGYLGWAIVSALDTDVVAQLRSAGFATAQQELAGLDHDLEATSAEVSDVLYRLVPLVADKAARQRVIRCRRRLFGWTPLPAGDLALVRELLRQHAPPPRSGEQTLLGFHDRAAARQRCLADLERSIRDGINDTRQLLRGLLRQTEHPVNLGVAFSAPDLWADHDQMDRPGGGELFNRQELSYLSYVVRTATKCTAYSTFSELRVLRRRPRPDLSRARPHRLVELNPTLAEIVLEAVLRNDAEAMKGTLIVSAYLRDSSARPGNLRWTRGTEAVGLGRSLFRNTVNLVSGSGPPAGTLSAVPAGIGLERLVDLGMVVRGPRSFGTEAARAALRRAGAKAESTVCTDLVHDCDRMSVAPAAERAELSARLRAAGDELIGLLGGRSARGTVDPVCYETTYGAELRPPAPLSGNAADLRRLEGILPIFDPLSGLRRLARELFDRRHPSGRAPAVEFGFELAEAIGRADTVQRVGMLSLTAAGEGTPATTNCDRELLDVLGMPPGDDVAEQALPLAELTRLADRLDWRPWHPVRDFAVQAQPRRDGSLVVEGVMDGWGRYLSRYTHPVEPHGCEPHTVRLPSIPGTEYAELSGLLGFGGNVACARTDRLLVLPGDEADPRPGERIALPDLTVVASGAELHLVSNTDGHRVLPLYLGTLAVQGLGALHHAMLPFSQFYWTDLPFHRLWHHAGRSAARDVVAMPRLSAGGLVVARRRWWVRAGSWPWWELTGPPGAGDYVSLERWRTRLGLPNEVYIRRRIPGAGGRRATKPQYVNFQSPSILQVAWRRFHGEPSDLVVSEALPGLVDGADADRPLTGTVQTMILESPCGTP